MQQLQKKWLVNETSKVVVAAAAGAVNIDAYRTGVFSNPNTATWIGAEANLCMFGQTRAHKNGFLIQKTKFQTRY